MKLGFVSALLPDLDLDGVMAFAAREGFDCVEVMCWPPGGPDRKYGGVTHIDVSGFSQSQADDIRATCEKHGVAISALGYYANPLAADVGLAEASIAHLRKVIDAAPLLGLTNVNSFIGANHALPMDENFKRFEQVWPDIVRHAEDRGVRVGIENCPMLYANTWPFGGNMAHSPAVWRRLFETIPSPNFGLNYDPSHLSMQLMDPIRPIYDFADRLMHVHAKDNRVEPDKLNDIGSLALPMDRCTAKVPGLGEIDWARFISALTDVGYNGPVCIEGEDAAFEGPLERRQLSLCIARNTLRPLMG